MNKPTAKKIAQVITQKQLDNMFENAKEGIKDWTVVSSVNKNVTKGTSWNILYKCFKNESFDVLSKIVITNMIWEFGDYVAQSLIDDHKTIRKVRKKSRMPHHQDPIF